MIKNQLHELIRTDRQAVLRELIVADRRAGQEALRQTSPRVAPPDTPDGVEWRSMIMLCRVAYEALEDEAADGPDRACPEPLESLRRHLIGIRKLLKAAADDERTIRAVRRQLVAVTDQRDLALDIAEEAIASLNRLARDETSPIAATLDALRSEISRLKRHLEPDHA